MEIVKVFVEHETELGDFVKCVDCDCVQLIEIGGENCGKCGSENLMWVDGDMQESTIYDLKNKGYICEKRYV